MTDIKLLDRLSALQVYRFATTEEFLDKMNVFIENFREATGRHAIADSLDRGLRQVTNRSFTSEFFDKRAEHTTTFALPNGRVCMIMQTWVKHRRNPYAVQFMQI